MVRGCARGQRPRQGVCTDGDGSTSAPIASIPKKKPESARVPVSDPLAAVLKEAIADGDARPRRAKPVAPITHVFLLRLGTPYTSRRGRGIFGKIVERAGVKNFHFHDCGTIRNPLVRAGTAGSGASAACTRARYDSSARAQSRSELHAALARCGKHGPMVIGHEKSQGRQR